MGLIVLVVLGAVLIGLVARFLRTERGLIAVIALAVVVVPLGYSEARRALAEHTYTAITRDLVERPEVRVHCQRTVPYMLDTSNHLGYVPWPPDGSAPQRAFLRHDTCDHLRDYVADTSSPGLDEVRAVHVLTHEAMHLRGELNESAAECQAIQRNRSTAIALGAAPAEADALALAYWRDIYPRVATEYRDPQCRPGGDLDESLDTSPWADATTPDARTASQ